MKGLIIFVGSILISFFPFCAEAEIYRWVDENGRLHFSDKPPRGLVPAPQEAEQTQEKKSRSHAASSHNEQNPKITADYTEPAFSETLRLRKLFEAGEFEKLNSAIYHVQNAVNTSISSEQQLEIVFLAFRHAGESWDALFEQWLARFPSNFQGYLARATYRVHMGWEARGGRYVESTQEENFRNMRQYFALAEQDIQETLRLNEKALYSYCLQMSIHMTSGNHSESYQTLQRALAHFPASYLARRYFIISLQPVWGGSLDAINAFAIKSQEQAHHNPKLKQLMGFSSFAEGRLIYQEKKYKEAIPYFTEALVHGDHYPSMEFRAKSHFWLKGYLKALEDFNKALSLSPENADLFYWRARVLVALNRPANAFTDINRAFALKPNDDAILKFRQRLLTRIQLPEQNSTARLPAVLPDANDAEAIFSYAKTQIASNDLDGAKQSLDNAIALKPQEFRYYQLIDEALFKMGQMNAILNYWAIYLVHQPDDGRAYLERAGTHYHLQDFDAAKADATRAMELGAKEAESFLKRLNQLTR